MPRDPYDILGVPRSATPEQIREAHRKLAKKFHPDLNKTAEAGAKFKEIQEAYDLLSDAQKRKQFDQFGHAVVLKVNQRVHMPLQFRQRFSSLLRSATAFELEW